jgi:hypothetical protein
MNCKETCELLAAYLDGEVAPGERAYIEAHLTGCPQCRAELETLSATQDNLRGMLKSMAGGVSPPAQAWESIRPRLEIKNNRLGEALKRLVPRNMVWRAVTAAALVVVLALAGSVWFFGRVSSPPLPAPTESPTPTPTPSPAPAPTPAIIPTSPVPNPFFDLTVTPYQDAYLPGEPVSVELSLVNISSEPVIMSPYPPEIEITLSRPVEVVQTFAAGSGEVELEPGEKVAYTLAWNQRNSKGQLVAPGYYNLNIIISNFRINGISFGCAGTPTKVLIQYPQGAMEKSLDLNQSQTVNGITITLQRVEMTTTGMTLYAFNVPPDYSLPQGPMLPSPQLMSLHATAEYSVDGGMEKQAGLSGIRFLDDGMLHTWDNLDPVPSDAKQLTFTITKLGEWEGPWEFTLFLE